MKYVLSLMLIITLFKPTYSQVDKSTVSNWEDGKLSWNDFKGVPIQSSNDVSYLSYTIGYRTSERKTNNVNIKWVETYCYVDHYASWVKTEYRSSVLLQYNQNIFNIVELYNRKLQIEINTINDENVSIYIQLDNLLRQYNSKYKERVSFYASQTEYGKDSVSIEQWAKSLEHELQNTPKIKIPPYKVSKIGYGMTFGLGYGFLAGPIANSFTSKFIIAYGFDFEYNPYILYLRGMLGVSKGKNDIIKNDILWKNGANTVQTLIDLALGYSIYNKARVKIAPFIGYGIMEFANKNINDDKKGHTLLDSNFSLGVNFDYSLTQSVNLVDYTWLNTKEKSGWIIRGRFTAMPFDYGDNLNGWSFNFTIGIGVFGNTVSL